MSNVGSLRTIKDRTGEHLEGGIATMSLSLALIARANPHKRFETDPDFEFFATNQDGVEFRIGAAWKKAVKARGREGEEFLSITLDDPSFEKPINVAAFQADGEPGTWNLVWRRRQDRPANAA